MAQEQVKFASDSEDITLIILIARRASKKYPRECPALETMMDVSATHANGNPLRLESLLTAKDFNFFHDIFGIAHYLDRETGTLTRGFRPRFSQPEQSEAA